MIFPVFVIVLISILIAAWVYHPREKTLLFLLRSGSIALFLLFLWNPACETKEKLAEKPVLFLLEDHTRSVEKYEREMSGVYKALSEAQALREKFEIKHFFVDTLLHAEKPVDWSSQTDLNKVLEDLKNKFAAKHASAVVLITDGVSTRGKDYRYSLHAGDRFHVFPVVTGDTTTYPDLKIVRVDYNKKVGKGNFFPLKIGVLYDASGKPVNSRLLVKKNGQIIYSKPVALSKEKPFVEIEHFFKEEKPGIQQYTIEIVPFKGEKIIRNNQLNIWFEVLDKKANILLLTSKIHPDAGVFKRILQKNKSYHIQIDKNLSLPSQYDLVIVFQPKKKNMEQLKKYQGALFWITGKYTDWQALNQAQNLFGKQAGVLSKESYSARLNPSFSLFSLPDFNKQLYPPLEDVFGEVKLFKPAEVIFYADVKNVATNQPVMVLFSGEKQAALFGDGLWRWYMMEKKETGKALFTEALIHKTVQELLSEPGKDLLVLDYKNQYDLNEPVEIRIQAYNSIGEINPSAKLKFLLKTTGETRHIPLFYKNGSYVAFWEGLKPGKYSFSVSYPQYKINRSGFFIVHQTDVENISVPSDVKKLSGLAENTGGKLFFPAQTGELIKELSGDKRFKTVFHVQKIKTYVTNKYVWLLLAVLLLAMEWFYRKSKGLI